MQAFHWCLDFDAAIREFGRILKPGGVVFLIWNLVAGQVLCSPQRLDVFNIQLKHSENELPGHANYAIYLDDTIRSRITNQQDFEGCLNPHSTHQTSSQ